MKETNRQKILVGHKDRTSKRITNTDVTLYAAVSGDFNPAHFDPLFAADTHFKEPVAHGMISAGLISGLIGTKLPGPGAIYLNQVLNFLAPVKVGDVITACVEVIELLEKNRIRLKTTCTNQDSVTVLDGEALVIAP